MKLLTPNQTQDSKQSQTLREILRTQETQKIADQSRKNLANAEADFKEALARQKDEWAEEELKHAKRKEEMESEINMLEAKRLNALIPVGIIKKGADDRLKEAVDYLAKLRDREAKNEQIAELLQDKLDSVGAKEQDLNKKSLELEIRQDGLTRQNQATLTATKLLSAEMAAFKDYKEKCEIDINKQKTENFLLQRTLIAKEEVLKNTDKALIDLAIQLADDRGTLQRAWDELERKKRA